MLVYLFDVILGKEEPDMTTPQTDEEMDRLGLIVHPDGPVEWGQGEPLADAIPHGTVASGAVPLLKVKSSETVR